MAKLRRLSGKEVIKILEALGFETRRITGSHHHFRLRLEDITCVVSVPLHGSSNLPVGTLRSIYRQISPYVPDDVLRSYFYAD
jgi:predicted RNA binding protein YcfA (HicA-like mRNA interferase family)